MHVHVHKLYRTLKMGWALSLPHTGITGPKSIKKIENAKSTVATLARTIVIMHAKRMTNETIIRLCTR